MYKEIGSFQAKTRLSELLQSVKKGQRYTITLHGIPIADLVPSQGSEEVRKNNIQKAVELMLSIKKIRGVSTKNVSAWISEGRR